MTEQNVQAPEVSPLDSIEDLDDYRTFRTTGELPKSGADADGEKLVANAKPSADSETAKTVQDEPGADELEALKASLEDPELPRGVKAKIQREIDRAVRIRKEAEETLQRAKTSGNGTPAGDGKPGADAAGTDAKPAETKPNDKPKPKLEDFVVKGVSDGTYPDYDSAHEAFTEQLTDWKLERARSEDRAALQKQQAEAAAVADWNRRADPVRAKYDDYDAVLNSEPVEASDALLYALNRHPDGPELAYHLIKDPAEVSRLNKLTDAVAVTLALEGVKSRFVAPAKPATPPRVSAAADPITPVGGSRPAVQKSLDDIDDLDDYRAMREKQRRR